MRWLHWLERSFHCRLEVGLLLLACVTLLACSSNPPPQVRISLDDASVTPLATRTDPASTATAPSLATRGAPPNPSLPALNISGSFRVAVPPRLAAEITPLLLQATNANPRLSLAVVTAPSTDRGAGADLAVEIKPPGGSYTVPGVTITRRPIGIALPLTNSPSDVSLSQALDLICGSVSNWSQVGGSSRPVRLAGWDVQALQSVGGLSNPPRSCSPSFRSADAPSLLAEVDGGADEAVLVPWGAPRLHSKALRIDGHFPEDAGYPLVAEIAIAPLRGDAAPMAEQLGGFLAASFAPTKAGSISVDAVGDLMLARRVSDQAARNGMDYPFAQVADRLRSADLRFANLEVALTDRGSQARKDYTFRAPPAFAQALAGAGFNVVDLANNHSLDFGALGLQDTLGALSAAHVMGVGAGGDDAAAHKPAIVEVNGLRIAWLAYVNVPNDSVTGFVASSMDAGPGRAGVAWGTPDAVRRDVAAAKQSADLVVVVLHAGLEYTSDPNSVQRDLAYAAIDAGATLVLGAHPHVLQGIEFYHGGVIAYSLGNFVFDLDDSDVIHYGLPAVLTIILRVTLDAHGVTGLEVYPAIINRRDFRPEPLTGEQAKAVYERIYGLTAALNTGTSPR